MNDAEHKALIERLEGVIKRNTLAMEAVVGSAHAMSSAMDDMGDQIRANTQAVLKALDRFDGLSGAA